MAEATKFLEQGKKKAKKNSSSDDDDDEDDEDEEEGVKEGQAQQEGDPKDIEMRRKRAKKLIKALAGGGDGSEEGEGE